MVAETLMWWLALPATLTLLLWIAELRSEGVTLQEVPNDARFSILLCCIIYPIGIGIWVKHKWIDKDE